MNICQRYLSKSLIFLSSILFLIVFLLESNFGFKLFFNVTNYFFWGLKTEEISGNWRDFTLKNITCNVFGVYIKATNVHILIDPISLFKVNKIFKKIETKNLIFSFNKNNLFSTEKKYLKKNILEKNIFFNNSIILKKIYADKILLKLNNMNILLFNVFSGLKLINNNLTIFRSHINLITLKFKKHHQQYFLHKKNFIDKKHINNFLSCLLDNKKVLLPINLNLTSIKCQKIKLFHYQFNNILFQGIINNQLIFKLKFNNFFKFSLYGKVLLNSLSHPMYINLNIHRFLFPIKKNLIFTSKKFNLILKGTFNNYYLSLKNIINISNMPSVFINIFGNGHLTNIYLNKICCIPFVKKVKNNKLINLQKENYNRYISQLIGNINISSNFHNNINSINIPSFNIKTNIVNRKLLILGALYYNQINNIKIPKINFFSGKNKGFISGSISKIININSSINANNLDYFIPNLKGAITATLNIYGLYFSPIFSGLVLGEKLNWKNMIYLNSIKMLINMNSEKNCKKDIFLVIKKIKFFKYYLDFLKLKINWDNTNQKCYLFLKNKNLSINFMLNGKLNYRTGIWRGTFNKINILSFNKKWVINQNPVVFFYNNKNMQINKKNKNTHKNYIFSIINKIKKSVLSSVFNSSINFKTNLFFKINFKSRKKQSSNIKVFLYNSNVKLQKKIKDTIFTKKISSLQLYIHFKKNKILTQWLIYPLKNKNNKLFGFLNIYNYFDKNNIKGKYFLFNFPCSILNFFILNSTKVKGKCTGNIKFSGTLYQPHILADIHLKNFYIKSNKISQYIILFFYPSLSLIKYVKINQLIFIKQGDVLFQLHFNSKSNILSFIEWNIFFNSNQMLFFIFPNIKLNLFSQLSLHYCLSKYDLIGYLKSFLFYFKINEKNFVF
ncbi:hypothetical protein D9V62_00435 [Buchnera aphidicola (Aphis helianthi)]|uniref:Translocation/assembly module TamB n=1 Tax=Buchnera aphidicola (Aphis helianthi) TaxID=2315802 RepID=A0A4D6XJK9_9GAMM|nr:hypothetical protein [Buchnera aphidicola]QCI16922.1 hypothetical protein D9V62_00435 [Buchnera aphidicola (Aphis helianthi)]